MFDIVTAEDFHLKLRADFDDLLKEPHSTRLALNCIITAYHLHEWVWGDWLKKDRALRKSLGVKDKKSFLDFIVRASPWFSAIRDLTNGTKHFVRNAGFATMRVGGYGQGPYGIGPFGEPYLLIDYGEGAAEHRWKTAIELIEVVVRFWAEFFDRYHPTAAKVGGWKF